MRSIKKNDTIQSLKTGLSILDLLAVERRPMRIIEIQEKTQITKSNLYKYMNTLLEAGMVYRESHSGLYYLGAKLYHYGMAVTENQYIIDLIAPYMRKISDHTENTALFATPTTTGPVILKIWQPNHTLNIGAEPGTLLPSNSASGKIYRVFSNEVEDNNKSIMTEDEMNFIRSNKIAFAQAPLVAEISSVSFPILISDYRLIGLIAVVGFSSKIPKNIEDEESQFLLEMQKEITYLFKY